MRKTTGFFLASLAFVTIAAVLAITLTAKSAEKRQLALANKNTPTKNTPTENTPTESTSAGAGEMTGVTQKYESTEEYESNTRRIILSDLDIYEVKQSTHEVFETTIDGDVRFTTLQTPTQEDIRCKELTGKFINGKFVGLEVQYDLERILETHGGAPGNVNVTWIATEDPPLNITDIEMRPLPNADKEVYRYVDTDEQTYIRVEHAVQRFSGTPKTFLEISGDLFFTPTDCCGKSRRASYLVDDHGFTFEVSRESCVLGLNASVECVAPNSCTIEGDGEEICVAAPSHELHPTFGGVGLQVGNTRGQVK